MNRKYIFPIVIAIIAVILLVINLFENVIIDKRVSVGMKVPAFEVTNVKNNLPFTLSNLKGKVTFINFWASWCKPCIDELPSINALNKIMSKNKNFQMISIAYKEDPEKSLKYLKKSGFNIPVYFDPFGKASEAFGVTAVPETYIINKNGIIAKVTIGPELWNSKKNIDLIYSLLQ